MKEDHLWVLAQLMVSYLLLSSSFLFPDASVLLVQETCLPIISKVLQHPAHVPMNLIHKPTRNLQPYRFLSLENRHHPQSQAQRCRNYHHQNLLLHSYFLMETVRFAWVIMFMGSPSGSCLGVSTCFIRTVLITGYHQELQAVPFVEPNHRQECGVHKDRFS